MLRPGSSDSTTLVRKMPAREVGKVRRLTRDEILFESGDLKRNIYRVETGAVCIYRTRPDGITEIVEYALAGDLVGLGFLERHATHARASVNSSVRCFPLDAAEKLIAGDAHNKARFDEAVEREFIFRRESLVSASSPHPAIRLAAFLTAVSQRTGEEGGDPTFIDDTVNCGVIADFLGITIEDLALALTQLETCGLIETAPHHGLRLKDLAALKSVADDVVTAPARLAPKGALLKALQ